jgi:hypothetical protein
MSALERSIRDVIRGDESDGELDKIVADLIVREAKEKNSLAGGAGAGDASVQSTKRRSLNTRFLNGIVHGVERHNRNLKEEEEERSAIAATSKPEIRQKRGRNRSSNGRMHGWEDEGENHERCHKSDASSSSHHKDIDERSKRLRRDESSSKGKRLDSKHEERGSYEKADERRRDRKLKTSYELESKMDKYFKSDYDPALDVDAKVNINKDNLVEDEGWERAISAIRERKRQKEERRESRKIERDRKRSKIDEKKRHRESKDDEHKHKNPASDHQSKSPISIMETRYTPKGSMREWDKGKK